MAPRKKSLFQKIKSRFTHTALQREEIDTFETFIRVAVNDGNINPAEMRWFEDFRVNTQLAPEDLNKLILEAFSDLIAKYCADRRITPDERAKLEQVANALELDRGAIVEMNKTIQYYELLNAVERAPIDDLPVIGSGNIFLKRGEIEYMTLPCEMLAERVVARHYRGGSRGVSIRVMKGVSFRVGQSRGISVPETAIVKVCSGELTLTNQRVVYSGNTKSFNSSLEKVVDAEFYTDGVRLMFTSRNPVILRFWDPRHPEIFGLYLSRLMNEQY